MTHRLRAAAFMAAAFFVAGGAAAQSRPAIELTPASPARWDLAAHVGWLAVFTSQSDPYGDDTYNVASGGVSLGRYLTPHLKTELRVAMNGEGTLYRHEVLPGVAPGFRTTEHHVKTASAGAGLLYQFFDNQWFHPYVGGGFEVLREKDRATVLDGRVGTRTTLASDVSHTARPFVATGFKWYVTERAFVRAGVQGSFFGRGTTRVTWTAAVGADL
jgi:outer membrane protein W